MSRTIPTDAVAVVIRKDKEEGFLDLQVIAPETGDTEYLIAVGNLAANLLEQAMFGEGAEEDEDDESFDVESALLDGIDFGDD
jgi:hypothetical protein